MGVPLPGRSCQRTRQFAVDEKKDSIELSILTEYKDVSIFVLMPADKAQIHRFCYPETNDNRALSDSLLMNTQLWKQNL